MKHGKVSPVGILVMTALIICLAGAPGAGAQSGSTGQAQAATSPGQPEIITVTPGGAYARAVAEAHAGRHGQALELLDQLPGLVPGYLADDVAFRRAESLAALGRRDEADGQYRECLELDPDGPWAETCRDRLGEATGEGS